MSAAERDLKCITLLRDLRSQLESHHR
jgi:hypothetical protein